MTWGMTAVAGATLVTGYMASESAKGAADDYSDASEASQAFERQKYRDWQETYGGIQDNLSTYYNSLTPEYYEAQGLEAFQAEQQRTLENVKSTLAQRGIEDSGIALASELSTLQTGAAERAKVRAQAPSLAAEEQRSFLQVGLGQNPGASYSRTLAEQAGQKSILARQTEQQAGQAVGSAVSTVGTALADYFNRPSAPPPRQDIGVTSANYTQDYSGYA